jgi:1-deoxy-D-xylulose-5-phosphate reductoisomerase
MKAQMGLPDMKLPIQVAMAYPHRIKNDFPRFDFVNYPNLTFEKPDMETFHCLSLAKQAMDKGGNLPCIMNAANEEAVAAFLNREIGFLAIAETIEEVMMNATFIQQPTIEDYKNSDEEARRIFKENLAKKKFVISPDN